MTETPDRSQHARTLVELYRLAAERFGNHAAFCTRQTDGTFAAVGFRELYEHGLNLGAALIDLGVDAREHVGLLADNRVEWVVADCGILLAGAADVPRGSDVTFGEIEYILDHADVKVVFVENDALFEKLHKCRPRLPGLKTVIVMDRKAKLQHGSLSLWDLVDRGRKLRADGDRRIEERIAAVRPEDLFTLIYTSGTTGRPKGVMLTHANMVSQVRNLCIRVTPADRMLSILPIWHCYERVGLMIAVGNGATTYYTSVRAIAEDLKKVKPTIMFSAPRLWESLYQRILQTVHKSSPVKRAMFRAAYFLSRRLRHSAFFIEGRRLDLTGRTWWQSFPKGVGQVFVYVVLLGPYLVMDGLVTRKLRAVLGGKFRATVSGGGALPQHVDEFFNYIGVPVLEGYGMTETSPVLAVRTWRKRVIGTVGPIWKETEIRITSLETGETLYPNPNRPNGGRGVRGEIRVRGPQVMPGYYKDPELTARVLNDGWLSTGDIGIMTFNDCLKLVGRSKETIVLMSGENVEPVPIENKLCESPYIDQCMVLGQDQKNLAALIVTDPAHFRKDGIELTGVQDLTGNPDVERIISREIKTYVGRATGFRSFEMIHAWRLLPKPFEIGDELTATYKLKRHVIENVYRDLISEIFHLRDRDHPSRGI